MNRHSAVPPAQNHWAMAPHPHELIEAMELTPIWADLPFFTGNGLRMPSPWVRPQGHLAQAVATTSRRSGC